MGKGQLETDSHSEDGCLPLPVLDDLVTPLGRWLARIVVQVTPFCHFPFLYLILHSSGGKLPWQAIQLLALQWWICLKLWPQYWKKGLALVRLLYNIGLFICICMSNYELKFKWHPLCTSRVHWGILAIFCALIKKNLNSKTFCCAGPKYGFWPETTWELPPKCSQKGGHRSWVLGYTNSVTI